MIGNRVEQRDVSQTISQLRPEAVGEGSGSVRQKGPIGRPQQQGKVYVMTQQEAEKAQDVMIGTLSIVISLFMCC